ncbi:chloramphenicol resistance permease RarD [Thalassotalea insulae]|uniref:Chloramphenicol resistance permease RarD n=1 Tax=Thalassotalea insulae TaxID=2056778 RepID=A0ABQ6GR37_9GAMM|nr:EamA family transporter RarD [Thalassotalea insulae]GLX78418.1 chloramphenicol resistance permease RarD [Thalassotalea insulae]
MTTEPAKDDVRSGVINAISAYLMWGLAPIYFKLLLAVTPDEIMVHRVVWSSLLLSIIVILTGKWRAFIAIIKQPQILTKLLLTATILGTNWFLFIWAVNNDHLLDASLGYFINPLLSVALGVIFLQERLRKWQLFAVLLAISGVLIQLISFGSLPIISLALASTFGVYGLLRKKLHVDSFIGLLVESMLMLPIALVYWSIFVSSETSNMLINTITMNTTLIFAGVVTTAPLLCFTAAAKRLTLSTVGFFQYIGPSIMFILATAYYQEPLVMAKLITFGFIWIALIIYSLDSFNAHKQKQQALRKNVSV